MIHLASVLIAADDPSVQRDLKARIGRHGYEGLPLTDRANAFDAALQNRPDIVLIAADPGDVQVLALAERLKSTPETAAIPLCLVLSSPSPDSAAHALDRGIDAVLVPPLDDAKLLAVLRPIVRLATMHAELAQRSATLSRFGQAVQDKVSPPVIAAGTPLLAVGPDLGDLPGCLTDAKLSRARDPYEADSQLDTGNFDAAILMPRGDPTSYLDLCAQIRNNPRLFNLPVIMIAAEDGLADRDAYRHGASAFFEQPFNRAELKAVVAALVRRQRLRWAIRDALGKTLLPAVKDESTGLYSRSFFDAYLADRVAYGVQHGREMSLIVFRIPDIERIRQKFGEEQSSHLRVQLAQWITGLLRAEDLTARYDENEFAVILPDTPMDEAEVVMNRIAGVLTYTDFAVVDVYMPVRIWVNSAAAALIPEDDPARLLKRARDNL